jgi:hypothetical protein
MGRTALGALAVGLLALTGVSACGADSTYPACLGAVRYRDTTYREVGFTHREGKPLNEMAAFVTCEKAQRDGVSKAFREGSGSVEARSLPGFGPDRVIVVQVTDSAWSVLVSQEALRRLLPRIRRSGLLNAGED